jgi:hypothetical protein
VINEKLVGNATIFWDERIAQVSHIYGAIMIDYAHYLFEERFIVGFGSSRSSC